VEDFDDWTSWLLYKGGVGVKGENSWESWWDEEQVNVTFSLDCNKFGVKMEQYFFSLAILKDLIKFSTTYTYI